MKQAFKLVCIFSFLINLAGCLASTTSPIGINCGPSAELPIWERPLDCQGR
jgi:hypothetical protein